MVLLPATAIAPRSSMATSQDILLTCTAPALDSQRVPVDGAEIVAVTQTAMAVDHASTTQTPMPTEVASIVLNTPSAVQSGQLLIASLMTFAGVAPTITPPSGWQLIRDDISPTTRQSLYYHFADANDAAAEWKFSQPVFAQGVVLTLDNVWATDPIDVSSGMTGPKDQVKAPALTTTDDGDLILVFFATDFAFDAPGPSFPDNTVAIVNQVSDPDPYWIFASYQARRGDVAEADSPTPQLYNAAAAQVAIRRH
jgi:hypothetical protein